MSASVRTAAALVTGEAAATDDIAHLSEIIETIVEGMNFFGEVHDVTLRAGQVDELQKIPVAKLYSAGVTGAPVVDGVTIPVQIWQPKAPEISAGVPMIIGNTAKTI